MNMRKHKHKTHRQKPWDDGVAPSVRGNSFHRFDQLSTSSTSLKCFVFDFCPVFVASRSKEILEAGF